jgi:hypothetical protein
MSDKISKFPRGLRVLITMAVLAVFVWLFKTYTSYDSIYYYYSIGAAALITLAVIYLTYRKPSPAKPRYQRINEQLHAESEEEIAESENESESLKPGDISAMPGILKSASSRSSLASNEIESAEISPIPLIEDPSSLTLDEKNSLVNAIWYRCENPYCKYTSFLSVHHIVEEKVGGTNKLDNLIVLCPYCHDLAHRGEIPETEMRMWIEDRSERWKFKPEWKYF